MGAGIGLRESWLGSWSLVLGLSAGLAIAAIFGLLMMVDAKGGHEMVRQPVRLGFEPEDTLYLVGPITWLGLLAPFVAAAGVGAPLYLLYVIWQTRRELAALAEGALPWLAHRPPQTATGIPNPIQGPDTLTSVDYLTFLTA